MRRFFLASFVVIFSGCAEQLVAPKIDNSPRAIFDELWREFDNRYATFAERHVDWQALHDKYASLVTDNMPDSMLLKACDSLLAPLRDGHVGIDNGYQGYRYIHDDSTRSYDVHTVSRYYLGETAHQTSDGSITYGRIHDSIGYINISTFDIPYQEEWQPIVDEALNSIWDTKALIVDLRENLGGTATAVETIGARFMPTATIIGYTQERYDADLSHLSAPSPFYSATARQPLWTKPIVILTSRTTMSAAEWCTMSARILPNVTVIGDTTQGAFSSRLDRELSNGWHYSMSFMRVSDANHVCHEGIGLIPDIEVYVRQNQRVYSVDTILDRALQFIEH